MGRNILTRTSTAVPPQAWFGVSAVFHYLGPSFAVLLFPFVGPLGVAWIRIATAAAVFAPITRPWRVFGDADPKARRLLLALGITLAAMNTAFYLALSRLPLSLVAAVEFIGTTGVALYGARSPRNLAAVAVVVTGVLILINLRWASDPWGLAWAGLNGALFVAYIAIGHRIASEGAGEGVERLGTAMAIALVAVLPVGFDQARVAFAQPALLLAGIGVGVTSSVIPYVCDQLAMAQLPRATFALMLALLPASAVVVGAIVLAQIPSSRDLVGIALVMAGVAIHQPARPR